MDTAVRALLADSGVRVTFGRRGYRPSLSIEGFETKILKPQNIVEMLHLGSRDIGFAGADWVAELGAELVELLDTELDPVSVVAATGPGMTEDDLARKAFVVASEYQRLTQQWLERRGFRANVVRSYGATEVFPPEDADCIVDNTATGETLRANGLVVVDLLMRSSTRFYAHPQALENPVKRERIERLVLLLRSVLDARQRVMLEVNVPAERLSEVIAALPAMRHPTMSPLHGEQGFALKAAVPRKDLPRVIPEIKARGGTDIVVTALAQIVA
jgi:ATP phosphoribosyltransferase